jgi:hypothetical protein
MTSPNAPPVPSLTIGGRQWPVESTRLDSATGYANFRQFRLACRTDTLFALGPTLGSRAFFLLFFAFGWGIVGVYIHTYATGRFDLGWQMFVGVGFGLMIGVGTIAMCLRGLTQTVRFDKAAGTITRRWALRTVDVRSLEEVVAIQFLDLGTIRVGGGRGGSTAVHAAQVNLVLEFPPCSRINLCTEPDEPFARETARQLASFLDVPLLGLEPDPVRRGSDHFHPSRSHHVHHRPAEAEKVTLVERWRMSPGMPSQATEEPVVRFYRLDGRKITLAEYWRLSPGVLSFLIVLLAKLLGFPPKFSFAIPRPERLLKVTLDELPASARFGLRPAIQGLQESGLRLVFCYRMPTVESHRLGAATVLIDESSETSVGVMFAQDSQRRSLELSCVSRLNDGTLAKTVTTRRRFKTDSQDHLLRLPGLDPVSLLHRHRAHLARLASEGLFAVRLNPTTQEEMILASEQRFVDFHAARGLFVPMTDKEVDRL